MAPRGPDGGRGRWPWTRWLAGVVLAAVIVGLTVPAGAQVDVGQGGEGEGPPRLEQREAPAREPEVLDRSVTAEGTVNTVVELPAEADAYIASEWPNQNFDGGALYLGYDATGEDSFGAERIVMRFPVETYVPAGVRVSEARLRLYLDWSSPGDDAPMGTVLKELVSAWSEKDVTWNDEPTWGEEWPGVDVGSVPGWYEWDLTEVVQLWVAGTKANHGVEIIGDEAVQERERAFYPRETTDWRYPRLVVTYSTDLAAPEVTVDPLPTFVDRDFTVSWSGKDPGGSGIVSYDVQYRVDGGAWANWIVNADPTETSALFAAGQDGKFYEFRARGEDDAGNVEPFGAPEASTTVDAKPPTTVVEPLPAFSTVPEFVVSWQGNDGGGSGIRYYDVRYRLDGGAWTPWQQQTLETDVPFRALSDGTYGFEARAVDNLGQIEDFTGNPEASIVVDTEPPTTVVDPLPAITSDQTFTVSWTGSDEVAGIDTYDVRYRYNDGVWVAWLTETTETSAQFSSPQGDGIYDFEARAVDAFGLQEALTGDPEASILVDAVAPFVEPRVWVPMVVRGF